MISQQWNINDDVCGRFLFVYLIHDYEDNDEIVSELLHLYKHQQNTVQYRQEHINTICSLIQYGMYIFLFIIQSIEKQTYAQNTQTTI